MKHPHLLLSAAALVLCILLSSCQKGDVSDASSSSAAESQTPEIPNYSLGLTENGLYEGYTALDLVTLPDNYDRIPSGEAFTTVSEEALQSAIDEFMSGFASDTQILDRPVEEGDLVNLENDMIGKYVEKLLQPADPQPVQNKITKEFLARYGY